MNTKRFLIIVSLISVIALSACSTGSPAASTGNTQATRQLYVAGEGKVYLTPDVAYIYVGVRSQDENVSTALTKNTELAQAVADAIKGMGVEDKDIQTSAFNVYPQQEYDETGKPSRIVYVVDNTVYITVHNLQILGDLLDKVVRSGANSINSISFDVTDKTEALSQARKLAIENGRASAEEMAAAAGVQLGALQSLTLSGNDTPVPLNEGKGGMAYNSASTVPVATGQMVITITASMAYEIK